MSLEQATRLDAIVIALCVGGRSFAFGDFLREKLQRSPDMSAEDYGRIMLELMLAEGVALVQCAKQIEAELNK